MQATFTKSINGSCNKFSPNYYCFLRRSRIRNEKNNNTMTAMVAAIIPKYCNADICPEA